MDRAIRFVTPRPDRRGAGGWRGSGSRMPSDTIKELRDRWLLIVAVALTACAELTSYVFFGAV